MPDASALPNTALTASLEALEIHVIPDKFYGAALKTPVVDKKPEPVAPLRPPVSLLSPQIMMAMGAFVIIVLGGFAYFNRDLFFGAPVAPAVVVETKPLELPAPPAAPESLTATSTNAQSVTLNWLDPSNDETGFRIERKEAEGSYAALSSLPANSTSFLDIGVQSSRIYVYRVRAVGVGGDSLPSIEATATVPLASPVVDQPKLPPAGLDSDSDGVTDVEETLYGTNMRIPDTDGDGFLDGNETFHLYNPAGKAPVKLLDSALIKVVTSRVGWILSIPSSWSITMNTNDGSKATIDTKHGETFVISVEDNPSKQPVLDWYLSRHPQVVASQVLSYRSKGGYVGILSADQLTTYLPWGDQVFALSYELHGQPFINFRTTYSMILNSLLLSGLPQISPVTPGTPLPFEPSATSTGVTTPPTPVVSSSTGTGSTTTQP